MKKIVIVGGYGAVGRVIAKQLVSSLPNPLVIAGRRLEPARELAAELGPQPGSGLARSFQIGDQPDAQLAFWFAGLRRKG